MVKVLVKEHSSAFSLEFKVVMSSVIICYYGRAYSLKMLFITIVLISGLPTLCVSIKGDAQKDISHLTNNFFANLEEHPYLKDQTLSKSLRIFIDHQISNYVNLIEETHGFADHSISRRSLPSEDIQTLIKDDIGVYMLNGFAALYSIKAQFPKDIVLFQDKTQGIWFATALECKIGTKANDLVTYAFINSKFMEIKRVGVTNGVKIGVYSTSKSHFVIAAEMSDGVEGIQTNNAIYEFDGNDEFKKIQGIKRGYFSDIAIWEQHKHVFMCMAQFKTNDTEMNFEVDTPIYKWLGKHFDIVGFIRTSGAKKITPFTIGSSHFIALANFQNNYGSVKVYSEVFKYNLHMEQFESYQRILTRAAVDVKYFSFKQRDNQEHFLVFANFYEIDITGKKNYNTDSIIYKYVDNYFIPFQSFKLNGATEWLPVSGAHGEFVLLVACKDEGIKSFQYNGWKFVETPVDYTRESFSRGVISMHAYNFNGKPVVVVANENDHGGLVNVFQPTFTHKNVLNKFQTDMLSWCQQSLGDVNVMEVAKITTTVEEAPKQDDPEVILGQSIEFDNLTVENFHTLDSNVTEEEGDSEFLEMDKQLDKYFLELAEIEEQVNKSMQRNGSNILSGAVQVQKLILNDDGHFRSFSAEIVNDEQLQQVLNGVIPTNEDFEMNTVEFENITVQNELSLTQLNSWPMDALSQPLENMNDLVIDGDVIFEQEILMNGKINGINFTKDNLLLNIGNQNLANLKCGEIKADKFVASKINNVNLTQMYSLMEDTIVDTIDNLNVDTANIEGFLNGVDFQSLYKYTLKTSGNQTVTQKYSFDELYAENVNVRTLSTKLISQDFILTEGSYIIDHDVLFTEELHLKSLIVDEFLNNIKVIDHQLDILLIDAPYTQLISGVKEFENVAVLNPIKVQGHISSAGLAKMNPVTLINDELILIGNYFIHGDVRVEQRLNASDLSTTGLLSVRRLQEDGIKVTDRIIPLHLNFAQQFNVQEIFVDSINDHEISDLIVMGLEEPQIISGWKTFQGDVHITGPTKLDIVNGIHLSDFEANILKIYGNQRLTGKYYFENVIANRIDNVKTEYDGRQWEDIITLYGEQHITGTTLIANSVEVKALQSNIMHCGSINGYNFTNLINDTVFHGQTGKIGGHKEFLNLRVENLHISSLDLNELAEMIEKNNATFTFDEDVTLPENIVIENILFEHNFNDVPREEFGHHWVFNEDQELVIETDQHFDKIIVYGQLFVTSGLLNDLSIDNLVQNSVKINEPTYFHTITFVNSFASLRPIQLNGLFESLDLNDIVQSHSTVEQIIVEEIIFNNDVIIFGELSFGGLVGGVNVTDACTYGLHPSTSDDANNLVIKGNAYFAIGPMVWAINNRPLESIFRDVWFKNREATITGLLNFNHVLFEQDLIVHGHIDEIKLELIMQTYLSKTRDQNVSAALNFEEDVVFERGIVASKAQVGGAIGGINLDEFLQTAIINGYQQTFESTVFLDECHIINLQGNYLVNGLDLANDVLRYSGENIVTGKKVIYDVYTALLTLPMRQGSWKEIHIQDVALLDWLETSVLMHGDFEITGSIALQNTSFLLDGVSSLLGVVNGMRFTNQTIMLKSAPQNVTGLKYFNPQKNGDALPSIEFTNLNVNGYLNGVDMTNLMDNQAYKNQNTVFTSPMNFTANLTVSRVHMADMYHNMNLTLVLNNVTHLEMAYDYYENYDRLLNVSRMVRDSFKAQAYFLDYYLVKTMYSKVDTIIPVLFDSTNTQHLAIVKRNRQNYSIEFDRWDQETEFFVKDSDILPIRFNNILHHMKLLKLKNQEVLYVEHFTGFDTDSPIESAANFQTSIFKTQDKKLVQIYPTIMHQGSRFVTSLFILSENKNCLVIAFEQLVHLYCEQQHEDRIFLELYQELRSSNVFEVVVNDLHIFMIKTGSGFEQPAVEIWKFNDNSRKFTLEQHIYVASPNSISAASYKGNYYLVIASGHIQNARHVGLVSIRRFNNELQKFVSHQEITVNAPLQVEFAKLPSNELVLYVVTDAPTQPLIIYEYMGISGFIEKVVASTLPKITDVMSFTSTVINQHFILVRNRKEIRVIQAVFKGHKN